MRRREGNKEQDILDASVIVFSRDGYFDTKMHKIADEAGIASGTIYLYFKNKEEILLKIFESVWEKLLRMLEKIEKETTDPIRKIHIIIDSVFDLFNEDPSLITVFVTEQHHILKQHHKNLMTSYRKSLSICQKVLHDGISQGVFSKRIDETIFTVFFFGGIRYALHQWAQDQKKHSLLTIRENIKHLLLCGLCK